MLLKGGGLIFSPASLSPPPLTPPPPHFQAHISHTHAYDLLFPIRVLLLAYHTYATLKFVYDIGFWNMIPTKTANDF